MMANRTSDDVVAGAQHAFCPVAMRKVVISHQWGGAEMQVMLIVLASTR